ncbi:MAG: hypothetical protein EA423_12030 [Phycisphaerales bacterium]|nr:MAG: hypothetical protein EA423_12030 [Phycisphaerales bacterium]
MGASTVTRHRLAAAGAGALALLVLGAGCTQTPREPRVNQNEQNRLLEEQAQSRREAAQRRAEAETKYRRGLSLADRGRTKEAIDEIRGALALFGRIEGGYNNLGLLLMEIGEYGAAAEAFTIESQLDPTDPRPLHNLGVVYMRRGWPKDARSYFEQSMQRDRNYQPALRGIVAAADLLRDADEETLAIIRRAMLHETDEQWLVYIQRQRYRVEQQMQASRSL